MNPEKALFPDRTFDTGSVRVALRTYNPGHELIRERCPDGQLWFTLVGNWMVRQEGRRRDVGPDSVQYYSPRQPAGREAATRVVAVGVQLRPWMLPAVNLNRPINLNVQHQLIRSGLQALVYPDQTAIEEDIWSALSQDRGGRSSDGGVVRRIRTVLHDEPNGNRSISEIAGLAGCHPAYAANAFRRAYGCSISVYRRRLRLKAVLTQLANGTPSAQAMIDAGFYDVAHFHRAFKAEYGVSFAALKKP